MLTHFCPSVPMHFLLGGRGATLRCDDDPTNLRFTWPSPIAPRDRTPCKGTPSLRFVFELFGCFRPENVFFILFVGKRGPACENIGRYLHFPLKNGPFWVWKDSVRNRDLEIPKILNMDKVDGIYLASPWGLIGRKTEPPDHILMFGSANVPGITYTINLGDLCSPFLNNNESSTKYLCSDACIDNDVY